MWKKHAKAQARKDATRQLINSPILRTTWDDCAHVEGMHPDRWRADIFGVLIERKRLSFQDRPNKRKHGDYVPVLISREIWESTRFKEACEDIAACVRSRLHRDLPPEALEPTEE